MKEQNNIDEIFKQAFDKFEVDPGNGMWAKVQSGVNAASSGAAASAASSSTFSWVASAIVAISITGAAIGGYFYFNEKGEAKKNTSIEKSEASTEIALQEINTESKLEEDPNLKVEVKNKTESPTQETSIENELLSKNSNKTTPASKNQTSSQEKNIIQENSNHLDEISTIHPNEADTQVDDNLAENKSSSNSSQSTESINTKSNASVSEVNSKENVTSIDPKSKNPVDQDGEPISTKENKEKAAVHIEFPNIFTPNQDGYNDKYGINQALSNGLENIENARMQITDITTGKVIYQWDGVNGSWDGTLPNGNLAPQGTYLYQFVFFINGEPQEPKTGILTLRL